MAKRQDEVKCEIATDHMIYVWADPEVIGKVKGIEGVYEVGDRFDGHHAVFVDHRYLAVDVAKEIVALA